jgi:putative membrane protein
MKKLLIPAMLAVALGTAFAADNGSLDKKDREFIEKAAAGGLEEVEAGKLGESKAQNADVKSFASMLNTDHSAANQELMALAQKKGVTVPSALPKKEQKKVDKLAKAKDFDKNFIHEQGIEDHKHDIKDFQKEAKDGKDPDVKAFAEKTLPVLQKHLARAEEISKSMKGSKG